MNEAITIPRRYRGPDDSGNGGYVSGVVGGLLSGDVVVTLRSPPPLETPLRVQRDDDGLRVFDGELLVAEAARSPLDLDAAEPVPFALAEERAARQPDDPDHPFPHCYVCGPAGDGFRLRIASVGDGRVAAPWLPAADEARRPEFVWAALDCPGAFAVNAGFVRGVSVLGRLHARVVAAPAAGERCVVVGWPLPGSEGRRLLAGTALYGEGGRLLGLARATWILVAPPQP